MSVTVAVGTAKGAFLYVSDDARRTWRIEGPLFKGWRVTAFGRTPDGGYLACTASPVYGPAVHLSADLRSWNQAERSPRFAEDSGWKLEEVWTLTRSGDRLYAGVSEAGLFRSDDGGATWDFVPGLTSHPTRPKWFPGFGGMCAHAVLADHSRPDRLWTGISAVGVFQSEDGGSTWIPRNEGVPAVIEDEEHKDIGFCVHALVQDPVEAETLYRQDHRGMFRSHDAGANWQRTETGLPSSFGFPLVIDPRTRTLFSFPLESDEYRLPVDGRFEVYRSSDRAASWEPVGDGLPEGPYHAGVLRGAMAVDGHDPAGVYLGSSAGEVFASADLGDSWSRLSGTLPRVLCVEAFDED